MKIIFWLSLKLLSRMQQIKSKSLEFLFRNFIGIVKFLRSPSLLLNVTMHGLARQWPFLIYVKTE